MVRGIRPHVEGRRIIKASRSRCAFRPIKITPSMQSIRRRSQGKVITKVRRLAKRVILELESEDAFVIEPRMTGLMLVSDPPDRTHLRFEWKLADKSSHGGTSTLWFWDRRGLGTLRLYSPEELAEALGPSKLGPDALAMTLDDWRDRLPRTQRAVKVALLDQKLVAGIGNLYASEILHLARIHPEHPSDQLKTFHLKRLHAATQDVLKTAIRYEGSTLADGTYRNALNQNGSYQNEHRVYARADELCPTCGKASIARIVQAQRSTFYCGRCQPESRSSSERSR